MARRTVQRWGLVALTFLLAAACTANELDADVTASSEEPSTTARSEDQSAGRSSTSASTTDAVLPPGADRTVERVVDGDTIVIDGGERVRLIGIDTPESADPRKPVECFGREASQFMESLLPPGTNVRLVDDVEQADRYGRTLAYVYRLEDGLFVNLELTEQGYAVAATFPPNVAHVDEFVEATRRAREAGRGLWSACR